MIELLKLAVVAAAGYWIRVLDQHRRQRKVRDMFAVEIKLAGRAVPEGVSEVDRIRFVRTAERLVSLRDKVWELGDVELGVAVSEFIDDVQGWVTHPFHIVNDPEYDDEEEYEHQQIVAGEASKLESSADQLVERLGKDSTWWTLVARRRSR